MLRPIDVDALLDTDDGSADPLTRRIVAVACDELVEFGLRRTTIDAIARRAEVSRVTVHRRFATKQELVASVFLSQIRRILVELAAVMAQHERTSDQLVEALAFGIPRVAGDRLFSRLLETDPEAMLPYLTTQATALVVACTGFVARILGDDQEAQDAAEALIRIGHSILLTPVGRLDLGDPETLRAFLRRLVDAVLD